MLLKKFLSRTWSGGLDSASSFLHLPSFSSSLATSTDSDMKFSAFKFLDTKSYNYPFSDIGNILQYQEDRVSLVPPLFTSRFNDYEDSSTSKNNYREYMVVDFDCINSGTDYDQLSLGVYVDQVKEYKAPARCISESEVHFSLSKEFLAPDEAKYQDVLERIKIKVQQDGDKIAARVMQANFSNSTETLNLETIQWCPSVAIKSTPVIKHISRSIVQAELCASFEFSTESRLSLRENWLKSNEGSNSRPVLIDSRPSSTEVSCRREFSTSISQSHLIYRKQLRKRLETKTISDLIACRRSRALHCHPQLRVPRRRDMCVYYRRQSHLSFTASPRNVGQQMNPRSRNSHFLVLDDYCDTGFDVETETNSDRTIFGSTSSSCYSVWSRDED